MSVANIKIPAKLIPVFLGEADVRGSWGGRGSAKTRTFAKMSAVRAYMWAKAGREGIILCGRQYMNSLDDSSLEEVKAAIRSEPWLATHFDIGDKYIKTICGRVAYKFAGLDRNIDSVKSKARILLCWIDEAEPVTDLAYQTLIPTLREEDSELWVTWNPKSKKSATHKRFRETTDPRTKIVEMNWRDNPKFPDILERQRVKDKAERPESYGHIWEGEMLHIVDGAIYLKEILAATVGKRFLRIPIDSSKPVLTFWDLGRADKTAIWFAQQVGFEYRMVDYYENQGFALAHYLKILQERNYLYGEVWLPHDAENELLASERTIAQQVRIAGYKVEITPKTSIADGIEAARTFFSTCYFDEEKCADGIDCLKSYKYDVDPETKQYSKTPLHDWASHGADAFRYAAVSMRVKREKKKTKQVSGGWMG